MWCFTKKKQSQEVTFSALDSSSSYFLPRIRDYKTSLRSGYFEQDNKSPECFNFIMDILNYI